MKETLCFYDHDNNTGAQGVSQTSRQRWCAVVLGGLTGRPTCTSTCATSAALHIWKSRNQGTQLPVLIVIDELDISTVRLTWRVDVDTCEYV